MKPKKNVHTNSTAHNAQAWKIYINKYVCLCAFVLFKSQQTKSISVYVSQAIKKSKVNTEGFVFSVCYKLHALQELNQESYVL